MISQTLTFKYIVFFNRIGKRIYNGVSGNKNAINHIFTTEGLSVSLSRSKVICCNCRYYLAIHFLGKGGVSIVSSQARLHVTDGNLAIERRERGSHAGRSVTVDQHNIGTALLKYLFKAIKDINGNRINCLIRTHYMQIVIGDDIKNIQDLI